MLHPSRSGAERAGGGLSGLDRTLLGRWMLFIVTKTDVRCLLIYVFNCVAGGESIRLQHM